MRLRYWAQEALKFTGIIMAAALFYTFLMIGQDTRETWNEYLEMGALYLGMFGACMCMILGTSVYQVHAPLAISLGSTRKEVLLGIQCYRFVIACILLAVAALLLMLTGETAHSLVWTILPLGVAAFLLFNSIGAVLGCLSTKLGRGALIAISILTMLLCVGGVGAAVLIIALKYSLPGNVVLVVLAIGTLVYAMSMIFEVLTIKKFSVK